LAFKAEESFLKRFQQNCLPSENAVLKNENTSRNTTDLEISTSRSKCILNMFYFKVFDIKLLNFPCPVF